MVDKKIINYIKDGLEKGYEVDELKLILSKKGWKLSDINKAVKEAQKLLEKGDKKNKKAEKQKELKKDESKDKKAKDEKDNRRKEKKEQIKEGKDDFFKTETDGGDKPKKRGLLGFLRRKKKDEDFGEDEGKKDENDKDEGEDKKKKHKKEEKPIVYKKPTGKLTTEVDDMLEIISNKKKIRMNQLAKMMKVKPKEVKEWTETLENWGIIEVHYPLFGDPVLTMAKKKKKEDSEKEDNTNG